MRLVPLTLALLAFAWPGALSPAVAPAQAAPAFGVQVHSLWFGVSREAMHRDLERAQALGAQVVRVDVGWGSLETEGKGRYGDEYVSRLDDFMREAGRRRLRVIATLWSTPCWASSAPDRLRQDCTGAWWDRAVGDYPPRRAQDYADAARWLAGRYRSRLAALEIWNEPNELRAPNTWRTEHRAAEYTALARATYPAVKAVAPRLPVLAGALSAADTGFLEELYAQGIRRYEDGISVHPYNEWRAPEDRWQPQYARYTFGPGLDAIRATMRAAGDTAKIWVTEFGWTTARGTAWRVTLGEQATYLVSAVRMLRSADDVAAATVYMLRAMSDDPSRFTDGFGLLRRDFRPKPAYAAVRRAFTSARSSPRTPRASRAARSARP